jgi:hypothetical protein
VRDPVDVSGVVRSLRGCVSPDAGVVVAHPFDVLPGHEVAHVNDLRWKSKKDAALLADAVTRGFGVFLTNDVRQLEDPAETDAIRRSGIHHVRYRVPRTRAIALAHLGLALGAVVAAMPMVMAELTTAASAADVIVFHDQLQQGGKAVADEIGSCTLIDPSDGLANCTGVVRLGEGTITYSFVNAPPPQKVLALTGGSGQFRTVRGDGTLVENGDGTGTLILRIVR